MQRPALVVVTAVSALALLLPAALVPVVAGSAGSGGVPDGVRATRQLVAQARAADSHCVAVVRGGRTVLDRDLSTDPAADTTVSWSVTKSVTSLLVGIAQDRGHLRLGHRVARYVPQWRRTPARRVRIRHLLAGDSGRRWSLKQDYEVMAGRAPDKTRFAINRPQQHPPGAVWRYNNTAVQVLEAVLERATGQPVAAFAQRHLFGPLRMRETRFLTDGAGNPMLYGGMVTTCRDLVRLGRMLVRKGRYGGRRIVSTRYWRRATQRPSQRYNDAYGLLFWINEPGTVLGSTPGSRTTGPMVRGAGRDAFWAVGLNGQYLFVSPSRKVVAVRLGAAPMSLDSFTTLALAAR